MPVNMHVVQSVLPVACVLSLYICLPVFSSLPLCLPQIMAKCIIAEAPDCILLLYQIRRTLQQLFSISSKLSTICIICYHPFNYYARIGGVL